MDNTKQEINIADHPSVVWLRETYLPSVGGIKSVAARELNISHKVLNGLLAGTYTGDTDRQLAKLDEQRQMLTARAAMAAPVEYVQTRVMHRIWAAADAAKAGHLINFVVGRSQIGKTTAARAYREMYPETTVYIRLTQKPTISTVVRELADALNLPGRVRTIDGTLRRLRTTLSPRHLIIVDEAHLATDRQQGADALDIIREMFDRTGCGALLLVTDLTGKKITKCDYAGQLEQLTRRGFWEILPENPCRQDVAAIWEAYGLPAPDAETAKTVNAMARDSCFGELTKRIRLAYAIATRNGQELTWHDFNDALNRMGRRPE